MAQTIQKVREALVDDIVDAIQDVRNALSSLSNVESGTRKLYGHDHRPFRSEILSLGKALHELQSLHDSERYVIRKFQTE